MRNSAYSTVDEQGNVIYDGPLTAMKGDHSGMPRRTEAYSRALRGVMSRQAACGALTRRPTWCPSTTT